MSEEKPATAPCKIPCPKCGSLDIYRHFREQGEIWDASLASAKEPVSRFINHPMTYSRQATMDCVTHHCRMCQFDWQTKPLKIIRKAKHQPKEPHAQS